VASDIGSSEFTSRIRDDERPTRKPLDWWDRVKLIVLWVGLYALVFWSILATNPIIPAGDALYNATATAPGLYLVLLAAVELVRQVHFAIAEHVAAYHRFWKRIFAGFDHSVMRIKPWTRFRLARVTRWTIVLYIVAAVTGSFIGTSPIEAVVVAPQLVLQGLPYLLQIAFYMFIAIIQFVAIFWFLSRGGIDVYMPDDIRTRFTDVWGQDRVLERIKENILFLENPEAIESRGGHVPGGILLWGPPGTGKTLMAEAVAGETGRPYVFVDPGAFVNMFFGIGVLKVKGLFRKLRKLSLRYGGVIVFFDEADTLGSRGGQVSQMRREAFHGHAATDVGCNGSAFVSDTARAIIADQDRQVIAGMGGGRSMDGTLQALLTELSGLTKPRGFMNRVVRRVLGIRPKQPPKYRILVMMATNMPDSLDPAMLRPGRIDRSYRVGYPTKDGRVETYRNYLNRIQHDLTDDEVDRLATISPYATGATIKDTVNEALVLAIRSGRDTVTYGDVIKAKSLKQHGLPDGGAYVDRERHSVALHEACHAVAMYRLQHTSIIDVATIERRGDVGGFVSPIPLEDRFVQWRSEVEVDVMTFLASLVGERLFYDGDHTQGVGGDMAAATAIVTRSMLSHAMGNQLRAYNGSMLANSGLLIGGIPLMQGLSWEGPIAAEVEHRLGELYARTEQLLSEHREDVLAVTHALEVYSTISGDDVAAVIEGRQGPLVDGRVYAEPEFRERLLQYHAAAVEAHAVRHERPPALPELPQAHV
jgi:ATP-dependent Zn protease